MTKPWLVKHAQRSHRVWQQPALIHHVLVAACLLGASGCSTFPSKMDLSKKMPWSKTKEKPEPHPKPAKLAITWTPDTLVQASRTPTRGFGGRLYFYDDRTRAVAVDGELTIHAFSELAGGGQGEVKRYQFTAEQFATHYSESELGPSYSVWIPWDAVGGEQMKISLVPSFRSKSGEIIQGEHTLVALPGKRAATESLAGTRPTAAALLEAQKNAGKTGLVTTTIPVRSDLMNSNGSGMGTPSVTAASSLAITPKPVLQSFDVPSLAKVPAESPRVAASSQLTPVSPAEASAAAATVANTAPPRRPLRLGSGGIEAARGVVPASATLPSGSLGGNRDAVLDAGHSRF